MAADTASSQQPTAYAERDVEIIGVGTDTVKSFGLQVAVRNAPNR
jgi:hypothetical protein